MNVGDRLYTVHYWTNSYLKPKREIESKRIIKINPKTVQLSWYDNLRVRIDEIDEDRWFTSEIKALENALKLHENLINKSKEVLKEINTLRRMIEYRKNKLFGVDEE